MNSRPLYFPLLLLTLASSGAAQSSARLETPATSPVPDALQVAPPEAVDQTVRKLAGQPVHGANGERLGTIKDFVIDKRTGEVVYAVISTGGMLGAGDTLRLIPLRALKPAATGTAGYTVRLGRVDWDRSPTVIEEAFGRGIVNIPDRDHDALSRLYGLPATPRPSAVASTPLGSDAAERNASPWLRASLLRGKKLETAGQPIGRVDEVVIDLPSRRAAALVDLNDHLMRDDRRVLMPLPQLALTSVTDDRVATTLTREDFARLDPGRRHVAEPHLLPTGRDSPAVTSAEATLASAARSARQALDNDPLLARADIRVTAENNTLILRGRVPTDRIRERAAAAVDDAASGIRLQNDLVVDPR